MKSATTALRTLLASGQFYMADCYTFILANGITTRYTTADAPITDQATGNVFAAFGPFFERSKVKFSVGVNVDELEITIKPRPTDVMYVDGPTWLAGLRAGVLDGAEVQLDRAFMASFGDTSAGLLTLFYGRVVEVDVGRTAAAVKVNTHLELLNLQWPWRLFQPGCSRTLFDAGCTLVKPAPGSTGTTLHDNCLIVAGSSLQVLKTNYTRPNGWASMGTLTFTSGVLSGQSYAIKDQGGATLSLLVPLSSLPAVGDGLTIYPGCDKRKDTCHDKFNNLAHFEGFPFVPVPETAA